MIWIERGSGILGGLAARIAFATCLIVAPWACGHCTEVRCEDVVGAPATPIVGAIRWDAWYDNSNGPSERNVRARLTPSEFHSRLPWFARADESGPPVIDGDKQGIIDAEIDIARQSHIDYWAFNHLKPPMDNALNMYLRSKKKSLVNFSLIDTVGWGATLGNYKEVLAKQIGLMLDAAWQKVLCNRPLYFIVVPDKHQLSEWLDRSWRGDIVNVKGALDWLRWRVELGGLGNPYVVAVGTGLGNVIETAKALGADAITSYEVTGNELRAPYANLAAVNQRYWNSEASSGLSVVPEVMLGWDPTPRLLSGNSNEGNVTYHAGTPEQIAKNVVAALNWSEAYPRSAPAAALLLYSWNEYDEGGSTLDPSFLQNDKQGDRAIAKAVGRAIASVRGARSMSKQGSLAKIELDGSRRKYDVDGRLVNVINADGSKINYSWDRTWDRYAASGAWIEHAESSGSGWVADSDGKRSILSTDRNGVPQLTNH